MRVKAFVGEHAPVMVGVFALVVVLAGSLAWTFGGLSRHAAAHKAEQVTGITTVTDIHRKLWFSFCPKDYLAYTVTGTRANGTEVKVTACVSPFRSYIR